MRLAGLALPHLIVPGRQQGAGATAGRLGLVLRRAPARASRAAVRRIAGRPVGLAAPPGRVGIAE